MNRWRATQAKAKFSEVLDKAETLGPQCIERRRRCFFLVTEEQYAQNGKALRVLEKTFVSGWEALRPSGELFDVDFSRARSKASSKPRAVKF